MLNSIKLIFLGFFGLASGMLVSGGATTVLLSIGLIPRFAGKLHVGKKAVLLENMAILGVIFGAVVSIFGEKMQAGAWIMTNLPEWMTIWQVMGNGLLILYGLGAGIFVGCLALTIAEMLDTIPIFARRTGLRQGIGIVITAMAFGKLAGSLLYFSQGVFFYGGQ